MLSSHLRQCALLLWRRRRSGFGQAVGLRRAAKLAHQANETVASRDRQKPHAVGGSRDIGMGLSSRNEETVPNPRLNVAPAQTNPRFAGQQHENLVLIVMHMKRRRVAQGRMVLHHACPVPTKLWRNPNDDKGIDEPQSLQIVGAHRLAPIAMAPGAYGAAAGFASRLLRPFPSARLLARRRANAPGDSP
jgi:hypothetical protein